MNEAFKKYAEKKKEREDQLYSLEDDWSVYGPNCPKHPGVRKLLVGEKEKVAMGYKKSDLVWQCPVDEEVFKADGSVAEQTDGFSLKNNLHKNTESITDEGFEAAQKLAKAMGYINHESDLD